MLYLFLFGSALCSNIDSDKSYNTIVYICNGRFPWTYYSVWKLDWNTHFWNGNGSFPVYLDFVFPLPPKDFYQTWLWWIRRVPYKKHKLINLRDHQGFTPGYLLICLVFCALLLFCLPSFSVLCPMLTVSQISHSNCFLFRLFTIKRILSILKHRYILHLS